MKRYSIRKAPEGWTVYDVWTDQPAEVHGVLQIGMDFEDADDLADALSLRQDLAD